MYLPKIVFKIRKIGTLSLDRDTKTCQKNVCYSVCITVLTTISLHYVRLYKTSISIVNDKISPSYCRVSTNPSMIIHKVLKKRAKTKTNRKPFCVNNYSKHQPERKKSSLFNFSHAVSSTSSVISPKVYISSARVAP